MRIIINATGRVIAIVVFCPISMGWCMRRRPSFGLFYFMGMAVSSTIAPFVTDAAAGGSAGGQKK
jgi:hypothetical protein